MNPTIEDAPFDSVITENQDNDDGAGTATRTAQTDKESDKKQNEVHLLTGGAYRTYQKRRMLARWPDDIRRGD